ncbi:rod shape-determining protein MreD [Eikenella longinqua]|uniref:Rod shape-determining protein MreD n=1 Tax=Eikenella longinqua TaxID=1795827 RepID=A0A1A9S164_9NEIS|nr:rod shape-determining protein MreD [Eikenella longinqua]OAM31141.1 rod shape-determining protein MreD [Eikenella longinqua]
MAPVNPLKEATPKRWVAFSFLLVLLLDFIPVPPPWVYPLPDFTLILLAYWLLHRPQLIGIGAAFCIGLLVDIGSNSLLGQHALAYTVAAFLIERKRRQIALNSFGWQAVAMAGAMLASQTVIFLVSLFQQQPFSLWRLWLPSVTTGLLWPQLNNMMLAIAHFRRNRK